VLWRITGAFLLMDCPGGVGGGLGFRFNLGPKTRCAFRLGEGPRAVGFCI
jgi:alpha-D-ribose 1-methylphosphonate 5-triphosphate synthase subunit PhnG